MDVLTVSNCLTLLLELTYTHLHTCPICVRSFLPSWQITVLWMCHASSIGSSAGLCCELRRLCDALSFWKYSCSGSKKDFCGLTIMSFRAFVVWCWGGFCSLTLCLDSAVSCGISCYITNTISLALLLSCSFNVFFFFLLKCPGGDTRHFERARKAKVSEGAEEK